MSSQTIFIKKGKFYMGIPIASDKMTTLYTMRQRGENVLFELCLACALAFIKHKLSYKIFMPCIVNNLHEIY